MLHRLHRQRHACHLADLARPEPAAVHDLLSVDRAARRDHVPRAVRALTGLHHRRLREVLRAVHARGLGEGVGRAGGVEVAVELVPERGVVVLRVDQRMALGGLLRRDELLVEAHVARLGALPLQVVVPVPRRRQVEAAGVVQADGLPRGLLDLLVEVDRVALQAGDVGVRRERVDHPGRVPRGARGERRALQQDRVLPAELREVEEDRAAHHAAADDDHPRVARQRLAGSVGALVAQDFRHGGTLSPAAAGTASRPGRHTSPTLLSREGRRLSASIGRALVGFRQIHAIEPPPARQ